MKKLKYFLIIFLLALPAEAYVSTVVFDDGTYNRTVREWINSLTKVDGVSSTSYISKKSGGKDSLHRAKHRDVITWIPDTTDLTKEFTLLIWFHGHYGYVPSRTFEDRTLKQIVSLTATKNFVITIPEMPWSVHTSTPSKRNSLLWTQPGDFLAFVEQVNSILRSHIDGATLGKIDYRIVGHSAGGSVIKRLGMTGDLCKLKPSMVVWSDSSYGPWLQQAWDGCLRDHRDISVKVFVAEGDSPWWRATQFMNQFQGPQKNLELHVMKKPKWSHKLIGNNIVDLSGVLE